GGLAGAGARAATCCRAPARTCTDVAAGAGAATLAAGRAGRRRAGGPGLAASARTRVPRTARAALAWAATVLRPHADVVLHVAHTTATVGKVFGAVLHPAVLDGALQRDLPTADPHLDVTGIDVRVMGQPLAQVFVDPCIRTGVVPRPHPAVTPGPIAAA